MSNDGFGRVGLNSDIKRSSVFDIDRFALETGQKARIAFLAKEFDMAWTHWVNGAREDGAFGNFLCLGNGTTLYETGSDPDNCVFCEYAEPGDMSAQPPIALAKRQFVAYVLVYATNKRGELIDESYPTCSVQAWRFGDDKFSQLVSRQETWKDLRQYDLMVTCTVGQFQRYDIEVMPHAVWQQDEDTASRIANIWKKGTTDSLLPILGRKVDPVIAEKIVRSVTRPVANVAAASSEPLSSLADLDKQLSTSATDTETSAETPTTDAETSDESTAASAESPVEASTVASTADASSDVAGKAETDGESAIDFDNLLNNL